MPTHRSSSSAKHLPIKGFESEAHQTSSDQRVSRGRKPNDFGHSPSVPASREKGEQSENQPRNGGTCRSSATAVEAQPGYRAARYNDPDACPSSNSQALNPRKRRVHTENPHADELLQTPRKKSKKRHIDPPRGKARAAYTTDTSRASEPQFPLLGEPETKLGPSAEPRRRCQPCREVKILPTIEHQIDPDNPRHSAHPWDDPLVQYINEDDTSHHCSQMEKSRRVSQNTSPTDSDNSFVPSPTAPISDSIRGSDGGLRRRIKGKSREDNGGGHAAHLSRRSESFPSPNEATNTTCMLKRESTAALETASSRHVSQNAPTRERSLLLGSRSDFRRAEKSTLASLGRQMLETQKQMSETQKQTSELTAMLTTLKSIAVQTNQHWAPQWPASVVGVALVGKTDNTTKNSRNILSPSAADSSTPWIETPNSYVHPSRKRAASHKDVVSIDRNNQYRDKRKRGPFKAASDARQYPPRPPAGVSSFDSFRVNDHQSGVEFAQPIWSNQHIWDSDDPAQDGSNASWGGNLPHEQNLWSSTDISTPLQRPTPHFRATPERRVSKRSPSDMHKNARRPIDHWSPANTPRSYDSSRMAQGACRDSFEPRPCQLDIYTQRDQAGIQRPSRSRNPFPHHRTRRREDRNLINDLHLDEHMDSRPYSHRSANLLLRSAPAPRNQGADISSSRMLGASTSVSTDEMVAGSSGIRSADSSSHLVMSNSNEMAGADDFEGLRQSYSEISVDEQNLEKALYEEDIRSMEEAEVAESEEKGTQDLPTEKHAEDEDQSHVTTRVTSRESSDLPDIEQIIAEAQDSQNHLKNLPISSMAAIPRSRHQSTDSMQTRSQGLTEELGIEAREESTLAQSDIRTNLTLTGAEAPRPLASSTVVQKMEPQSTSSNDETDVPGTLDSQIASHIRGPTDRQISTHGPTSSDLSLPAASKMADCVRPQQILSFPNTIEVRIPCRTNTHRQFMRPIPSKGREIEINSSRGISQRCKCSHLPEYFRNPPSLIPSFKTWPGEKMEFLAHCQQIVDCPAHPDITRNNCRDILSNQRRQRAVHGALASQEAPTEMNKSGESTLSKSDRQQLQRHADTLTSPVLDNGKVSGDGDPSKQKVNENPSTRSKFGNCTKSPSQRSRDERPQFRIPPGFPCSPLTEPTGDSVTISEEIRLKGSRSRKSHKNQENSQSHKTNSTLPTPANSSSPSRAEADDIQQPTNDHQASHSSQQLSSAPNHVSKQQPDLTDQTGHATFASPLANNGSLQNAESAGTPERPSGAVVHDKNPSTPSKVQKARKHARRNDSTVIKKHINAAKSPRRHAKLIRRRHATEPPHAPKLMTPVKALKNLSQNPPREPLFPVTNPSSLNQQTRTPPVVGQPTNPPSTARPLWQRTPPPTPPNVRRKSYIPADERKQSKPVLSRHVPPRDRESDEKLIEYGRLKCTYDRHLAAPYAFRWCGKLYHEYRYLVALRDEGGELLWDEVLGRRLGKK
ncbi:MAG: hypothetical protein LQ337_007699 [Flavoplaca oasis]|nr:MAG: hypothetical protein LQ337_007699 [Flavoplaca oasis]